MPITYNGAAFLISDVGVALLVSGVGVTLLISDVGVALLPSDVGAVGSTFNAVSVGVSAVGVFLWESVTNKEGWFVGVVPLPVSDVGVTSGLHSAGVLL